MNITYQTVEPHGGYRELLKDRSGFQRVFNSWLVNEPALRGRVLDIGCGGNIPPFLPAIREIPQQLDGVDPDPIVNLHPSLTTRWHGRFEDAAIPVNQYDLAYAYNVVEHIPTPSAFLEKVWQVLRPGGVFWALTPNAAHPFAWLARGIEQIGGKRGMRELLKKPDHGYTVNNYPSYYRLNCPGQVRRALALTPPFRDAAFSWYPCMQWDTYFPWSLRGLPHLYDFSIGIRVRPWMQIFAFRLTK